MGLDYTRLPKTTKNSANERLEELCEDRQKPRSIKFLKDLRTEEIESRDFRLFPDGFEALTEEYHYMNDNAPRWHTYISLFVQSRNALFKFYYGGIC